MDLRGPRDLRDRPEKRETGDLLVRDPRDVRDLRELADLRDLREPLADLSE